MLGVHAGAAARARRRRSCSSRIDTLRADRVGAYGDAQARTPQLDALARDGRAVRAGLYARAAHAAGARLDADRPAAAAARRARQRLVRARRRRRRRSPRRCGRAASRPRRSWARFRSSAASGSTAASTSTTTPSSARPACTSSSPSGAPTAWWTRPRRWLASAARARCSCGCTSTIRTRPTTRRRASAAPTPTAGEIAFADAMLGRLARRPGTRGPAAAVVAVTADHGEAFGEHGEESHGLFVYDTTLRVPLLLRGPGVPAARRDRARACRPRGRGRDARRARRRAGPCPGASLARFARATAEPAADSALRRDARSAARLRLERAALPGATARYKYIRAPRPELYDVDADPGESRNLAATPEVATRHRGRARRGAAAPRRWRRAGTRPDPEAVERLRALGYVQGLGGRGSGADPKDRVEVRALIARATGPFAAAARADRAYGRSRAAIPRTRS